MWKLNCKVNVRTIKRDSLEIVLKSYAQMLVLKAIVLLLVNIRVSIVLTFQGIRKENWARQSSEEDGERVGGSQKDSTDHILVGGDFTLKEPRGESHLKLRNYNLSIIQELIHTYSRWWSWEINSKWIKIRGGHTMLTWMQAI